MLHVQLDVVMSTHSNNITVNNYMYMYVYLLYTYLHVHVIVHFS